ncbi:MAG: hypothetical protein ACTHXA_07710 [Gulosibacter sp.]|uniref:hypothetical protein n=1 Tax=Gulosibacter sp. TaxID=2817531 RepID=UPI003F92E575
MHRILTISGAALALGGILSFVAEAIGAVQVEIWPGLRIPLWIFIAVLGIVMFTIGTRMRHRRAVLLDPSLSAPATVIGVTLARKGDEDSNDSYNIDLVVQPENEPSFPYRHHRGLNKAEVNDWYVGKVVAVRRRHHGAYEVQIDRHPSEETKQRILLEKSLASVREADLGYDQLRVTPSPPKRSGASRLDGTVSLLGGLLIFVLAFPTFIPMLANSSIAAFDASTRNHHGLLAPGALDAAVERLDGIVADEVIRVSLESNYTLEVLDVADPGTSKIDRSAVRGDRVYGTAPLAYRMEVDEDTDLFSLADVNWAVLPESLDACEAYYEDPSAERISVTGEKSLGTFRWTATYYGDYGSFSCIFDAAGTMLE